MGDSSAIRILNDRPWSGGKSRPPLTVVAELLRLLTNIVDVALPNGGHYMTPEIADSVRASERFEGFEALSAELRSISLINLGEQARLTFYVNLYNLMCFHAALIIGMPTTILQKLSFFKEVAYDIGGLGVITPTEVEHSLLRAPMSRPATFGSRLLPKYTETHARFPFVLKEKVPLLSFGLCCGAYSGPRLHIFEEGTVLATLDEMACKFLQKTVSVDANSRTLVLPKLIDWYKQDFVEDDGYLYKWVLDFLTSSQQLRLCEVLKDRANVAYKDYDWTMYYYREDLDDHGIPPHIAVMSAPSRPKVEAAMDGYLTKQGKFRKSWKSRYFSLEKNVLYYRKAPDDAVLGLIPLAGSSVRADLNNKKGFKICTQGRTYDLVADSAEECRLWLNALTTAAYEGSRGLLSNERRVKGRSWTTPTLDVGESATSSLPSMPYLDNRRPPLEVLKGMPFAEMHAALHLEVMETFVEEKQQAGRKPRPLSMISTFDLDTSASNIALTETASVAGDSTLGDDENDWDYSTDSSADDVVVRPARTKTSGPDDGPSRRRRLISRDAMDRQSLPVKTNPFRDDDEVVIPPANHNGVAAVKVEPMRLALPSRTSSTNTSRGNSFSQQPNPPATTTTTTAGTPPATTPSPTPSTPERSPAVPARARGTVRLSGVNTNPFRDDPVVEEAQAPPPLPPPRRTTTITENAPPT